MVWRLAKGLPLNGCTALSAAQAAEPAALQALAEACAVPVAARRF